MKRLLLVICLLNINVCFANADIHKENIKGIIDEVYLHYSPLDYAETLARGRADYYLKDEFHYNKCEYNCIAEKEKIRRKANNFSPFIDTDAINKEARGYYNECIKKCQTDLEDSTQEYYEYINTYIELKNQARKK